LAGIHAAGNNGFSALTVEDLRQDVLAMLLSNIPKFDAAQETSFSAWLYAFGRHAANNYRLKTRAAKRGGGKKGGSPSLVTEIGFNEREPDFVEFEGRVFRAKVMLALRNTQSIIGFEEFQAYYLKVASGLSGTAIATLLGTSPSTVSRFQSNVRQVLRKEISSAVAVFSWNEAEVEEPNKRGLRKVEDTGFDEALAAILLMSE